MGGKGVVKNARLLGFCEGVASGRLVFELLAAWEGEARGALWRGSVHAAGSLRKLLKTFLQHHDKIWELSGRVPLS